MRFMELYVNHALCAANKSVGQVNVSMNNNADDNNSNMMMTITTIIIILITIIILTILKRNGVSNGTRIIGRDLDDGRTQGARVHGAFPLVIGELRPRHALVGLEHVCQIKQIADAVQDLGKRHENEPPHEHDY